MFKHIANFCNPLFREEIITKFCLTSGKCKLLIDLWDVPAYTLWHQNQLIVLGWSVTFHLKFTENVLLYTEILLFAKFSTKKYFWSVFEACITFFNSFCLFKKSLAKVLRLHFSIWFKHIFGIGWYPFQPVRNYFYWTNIRIFMLFFGLEYRDTQYTNIKMFHQYWLYFDLKYGILK